MINQAIDPQVLTISLPVMGGMAVVIVDIVGVIVIGHALMAAAIPVDVNVVPVGNMGVIGALVPVPRTRVILSYSDRQRR